MSPFAAISANTVYIMAVINNANFSSSEVASTVQSPSGNGIDQGEPTEPLTMTIKLGTTTCSLSEGGQCPLVPCLTEFEMLRISSTLTGKVSRKFQTGDWLATPRLGTPTARQLYTVMSDGQYVVMVFLEGATLQYELLITTRAEDLPRLRSKPRGIAVTQDIFDAATASRDKVSISRKFAKVVDEPLSEIVCTRENENQVLCSGDNRVDLLEYKCALRDYQDGVCIWLPESEVIRRNSGLQRRYKRGLEQAAKQERQEALAKEKIDKEEQFRIAKQHKAREREAAKAAAAAAKVCRKRQAGHKRQRQNPHPESKSDIDSTSQRQIQELTKQLEQVQVEADAKLNEHVVRLEKLLAVKSASSSNQDAHENNDGDTEFETTASTHQWPKKHKRAAQERKRWQAKHPNKHRRRDVLYTERDMEQASAAALVRVETMQKELLRQKMMTLFGHQATMLDGYQNSALGM